EYDQGSGGLAWSPDSKWLLTCGFNDNIEFWDTASGQQVKNFGTIGYIGIAWSRDGTMIAAAHPGRDNTASDFNTVLIWQMPGGTLLRTFRGQIWPTSVSWSPDSKHVVTGSDYSGDCGDCIPKGADSDVRIWDL